MGLKLAPEARKMQIVTVIINEKPCWKGAKMLVNSDSNFLGVTWLRSSSRAHVTQKLLHDTNHLLVMPQMEPRGSQTSSVL